MTERGPRVLTQLQLQEEPSPLTLEILTLDTAGRKTEFFPPLELPILS